MKIIQLESLLWVAGAIAVLYYSNFFYVLATNPGVNELFLGITLVFLGVCISLTLYVGIILPYILGVREDIETYNPKIVTLGAVSGFVVFVSLIIAAWPVWGWWIIPMVFIMFLGYISTLHFLPSNALGSLLFFSFFFLAIGSACFIEHEGYWHHNDN